MINRILLLFLWLIFAMPINIIGQENEFEKLTSLVISFEGTLNDLLEIQLLKGEFEIIQENDAYYGLSSHNLYCGTDKIPNWKTKLSKSMVSEIRSFISELEQTENKVSLPSYWNDNYTAQLNGEKWYIKPDQSIFKNFKRKETFPDILPDLSFYKSIFSKQIKTFKKNYKSHKKNINKLIQRKWYYNPEDFDSLNRGDEIKLYANSNQNTIEFWEINSDLSFKRSNDQIVENKSKVQIEYARQEVISEFMYLTIYCANLLDRTDLENQLNEYTSFYIIELSKDELVLKIAY